MRCIYGGQKTIVDKILEIRGEVQPTEISVRTGSRPIFRQVVNPKGDNQQLVTHSLLQKAEILVPMGDALHQIARMLQQQLLLQDLQEKPSQHVPPP